MSRYLRQSSTAVYQAKWAAFTRWCASRKIKPLEASIPDIADFLVHLRDEVGMSIPAVKGVRATLGQVFLLKGIDLGASRHISMLIKSFEQSYPPFSSRVLQWDVARVLDMLSKPPFEPLKDIVDRNLTLKAVFLLALASAKRVGEIHGLSYEVEHSRGWRDVSFKFVPSFVAKTQNPSVLDPKFEGFSIPAIPRSVNQDDLKLCPVRAIRKYLKRTANLRPGIKNLFVSTGPSKKQVSKNTISFWLRQVIIKAYTSVGLPVPGRPKAHDVRGISTSLAFEKNMSISIVLIYEHVVKTHLTSSLCGSNGRPSSCNSPTNEENSKKGPTPRIHNLRAPGQSPYLDNSYLTTLQGVNDLSPSSQRHCFSDNSYRCKQSNHLITVAVFSKDFFSEDLWNRIKSTWREVLIELTPSQIADFLSDKHVRQKKVWPLSLQAFRVSAFTYALPRKPVTSDASFKDYVRKHDHWLGSESGLSSCTANFQHETFPSHSSNSASSEKNLVMDNFESNLGEDIPWQKTATVSWEDAFSELNPKTGQHKLLQHIFRRHMKPKKQHEVARLAYIAGQVARCVCNNVMVDVGSGQGHLSRFLAYGHDVRVLCIEAQDEFIRGAQKFDNQLKETVKKMNRKYENLPPLPPSPRHTLCHLEPNIDPEMFREVVTRAWPELEFCGFEHGLLGLHTCGDLGPTLLRIFTNLPSCQAVVSVGCCYMKLTVDEKKSSYSGYPMSTFVQSLRHYCLSYEAREVACHAIEIYSNRLYSGADNLKVHCYRAALEEIIVKHWPEHRHAGLRSVNHAHEMEFSQYAEAAVTRLSDVSLSNDDVNSERTRANLSRWMQVVVYYSLRLLLAPVVESIILLDRLLFLYENDIEGILLPAFDPHLSPRNHVLVAIKNKEVL
ncbi:uncharacterized protein [Palaemon carinicauda]|uniref:uncharacterized protein n=1 Tax=Palaemon carinicauda TaxID=392227 RepID=UPI0035B6323E